LKRLADQEDGAQLSGALADAAHDSDDKVREAALEVMEDMGKDAPANLLMEMALADTNPALRKQALQLLSEINGEAALEPLNQARTDNDAEVRNLATELLDAINNSSGGPSE
jgi:HEAT repeat protein